MMVYLSLVQFNILLYLQKAQYSMEAEGWARSEKAADAQYAGTLAQSHQASPGGRQDQ